MKTAIEIWSPLPPEASGVADYVHEQLDALAARLDLTLVASHPERVAAEVRERHPVIAPANSDPARLRLYHLGNSPAHAFIYREALRQPGVVFLHEWNLHELIFGLAVSANHFAPYLFEMRREHGERGSVAGRTVARALGGQHWTAMFPLNASLLENALAVVAPATSTAARAAARCPGLKVLRLPLHCTLAASARSRSEARQRLGFAAEARLVLAPGLGTFSKSLAIARRAVARLERSRGPVTLVTVGGVPDESGTVADPGPPIRHLGRVALETLGDALRAADVVLALRFPSRGESSAVLMRALAAGRACVVSAGSTADEDLPEGVVARVSPGPAEEAELAAILDFLLGDEAARLRMERLARATADRLGVEPLCETLAEFLEQVASERADLEEALRATAVRAAGVLETFRSELDAAASSLGLARLPRDVYARLSGLP